MSISSRIARAVTTGVLALAVPVAAFVVLAPSASSQLVTVCDTHEVNILDHGSGTAGTIRESLGQVEFMVALPVTDLLIQQVSATEAVAVWPDQVAPVLTVSAELGEGGWGVTEIDGCPEFVVDADELNGEL